jgi:uncharacterized membrane protein
MAETAVVKTEGLFISEIFKKAWALFKEEWITFYALQLLPIIVAVIYSWGLESYAETSDFGFIWVLLYLVVQIILSMGLIKGYLQLTKGKKVTMETFTSVAPLTLKYLASQILMGLIVLGGFILFIIPGVIFSIKYMFTPYLVIDKGMGPIEALKASGKITDGIKWDMVGFLAAAAALTYIGILALFVGLLVTIPVATFSYVLLYNKLVKRLK